MKMKKVFWNLLVLWLTFTLPCLTLASVNYIETFDRAFEEWVITSLRIEENKTDYLTRETVAPLLMNYIRNVARRAYKWEVCDAKDIDIADPYYQDDLRELCDYWILRWSNKKIAPKRTLTKQEAVALVMRIIDWEQKEKKNWHWAYNYYTRAKELGFYWVPDITKDENPNITIEEFINFLYSTEHTFEKTTIDARKVKYNSFGDFKSSEDALLKLTEIFNEK
jgi:hypothetical protein